MASCFPSSCTLWNCCVCPCVCTLEATRQILVCCAGCVPCCGCCCSTAADACCPNPTACYNSGGGGGDGRRAPIPPSALAMDRGAKDTRFFVL